MTGIVNETDTFSSTGGLDGGGLAISSGAFSGSQDWDNLSFSIGTAGGDNVVQATGQTIALPAGQFTQLELLATSVGGDLTGQEFVVNYADGTSDTFSQDVSDWTAFESHTGESRGA